MDLFSDLLIFARVVDCGSFSAAAGQLGMAKSSVSKRVAALEARYGVRLIQRTTRQLRITDDGMALYQRCQRLQEELAATEAQLTQLTAEPRGRLRVSAPPLFSQVWLAPLVPVFLQRYPAVQLELHLTDARSDPIREGYDILIRLGELPDSSLVGQRLAEIEPVVCAAPDYLARQGTPRAPADLARHNCLLWQQPRQPLPREWVFFQQQRRYAVSVSGNFSSNDTMAIRQAARAGLGVAILPDYMLDEGLVPLLREYRQFSLPVYALYGHRTQMGARQRAFIELLREFAAGRPGELPVLP